VLSHAAFRYVDAVIGAIVTAALVRFAVTAVNAPGQREDPGVLVLRMLPARAAAHDIEASRMRDEPAG
jgi:hypothetical protein